MEREGRIKAEKGTEAGAKESKMREKRKWKSLEKEPFHQRPH